MIKKYMYDNNMIAVSTKTKKVLKRIKEIGGLKNMDETINYLLRKAGVL